MTRAAHTYVPLGSGLAGTSTPGVGGSPGAVAAVSCVRRPKVAFLVFGAFVALLFTAAFWPGGPLTHAPSRLNALIHSGKAQRELVRRAGVAGPAAAAAAARRQKQAAQQAQKQQKQQQQQQQQQQQPQRVPAARPQHDPNPQQAGAAAAAAVHSRPAAPWQQKGQRAAALPAAALPAAAAAAPAGGAQLLELFVMSQCPDASFCEHAFERILKPIARIVEVRTWYIQQEKNGQITCKHGDAECAGNLAQLCVQAHAPPGRSYDFLRFLVCVWDSGLAPGSPEARDRCLPAAFAGAPSAPPRAAVEACIAGAEGAALMRASAGTVAARGVVNSCTVALEGQPRCVRDGGEWRDCPGGSGDAEFRASICAAYRRRTGRDAPECGASAAAAAAAAMPAPGLPAAARPRPL
ncbi:hypothetical protein Rsub_07176 [Raphidocelis subcapitata]|uniref:Gamma-interferon-inducible lysosomal thiol reductase n=1 Tax=Raphidocelis subcapitata TaxID=307507 RepID=A0A2V0P3M7_9CHLO|nr:hypothetical protein Rsub_07176 [Raphidocelis subcapitata]|eukprot:GBF94189.1 hypothetical protein Rsub_07176 [Raphidocelis subcapitata]